MVFCIILRSLDALFNNETQTKKTHQVTFMVDLDSKESYIEFLKAIKHIGMNREKYHYLLVNMVNYIINRYYLKHYLHFAQ